jgi:hypothetical protein
MRGFTFTSSFELRGSFWLKLKMVVFAFVLFRRDRVNHVDVDDDDVVDGAD